MIKTQTNPELLNELRELFPNAKSIHLFFEIEDTELYLGSEAGETGDMSWITLSDDSTIEFVEGKEKLFELISVEGGNTWNYLRDLTNYSDIVLWGLSWGGKIEFHLDKGIATLHHDDNYDSLESIENELSLCGYEDDEAEEFIENLPEIYKKDKFNLGSEDFLMSSEIEL